MHNIRTNKLIYHMVWILNIFHTENWLLIDETLLWTRYTYLGYPPYAASKGMPIPVTTKFNSKWIFQELW